MLKVKVKVYVYGPIPRPYGFTRLYASRSEDLTITSLTQTCYLVIQSTYDMFGVAAGKSQRTLII